MTSNTSSPRVVVVGGGPGGYAAAFRAADAGMTVTMVDREAAPGGVCLHSGCIPSKTLLHIASLLNEAEEASAWGIDFGTPTLNIDKLRAWKDRVISQMTSGLEMLTRTRNIRFVQGNASFESTNALRIESAGENTSESIGFDYAVIATGSRPAAPPGFQVDGARVLDSTAALNITDIPASMLVIGGGYIGLELGTVYAALGSRITMVEMESGLLPGADRDLLAPLQDRLEHTFDSILLNTRVDELKAREKQVMVNLTGPTVEDGTRSFDKVLIAVGRQPNTENLGLEHAGVETNQQGFIKINAQRRTTTSNILAIGDVAGEPMLAHKAAHEAHVAVAAIQGQPTIYAPHAVPAVVFTDPEIAWCGLTESEAQRTDTPHTAVCFPWTASGRATTRGRNDGLTKLILEPVSERVLGFGITGVGAGELIAEGVLAVEMGARAEDLRLSIHPHPTLSETLMEAADVFFDTSPHFIARPKR